MHARGGKYTFHTTTEDCNVCAHCLALCGNQNFTARSC
jgi:hypothetical protein